MNPALLLDPRGARKKGNLSFSFTISCSSTLSLLLINFGFPSAVMYVEAIELDMSGVPLYSAASPMSSLDAV